MASSEKPTPGIEVRHGRGCPATTGGACGCEPTYRAWAYDRRGNDGKGGKVRKTFPTLAAAKAWRADAVGEVRRGKLRAAPAVTLREVADRWLEGASDGTIRNRSGDVYKPSVLRGYKQALRDRILPELGARRVSDVGRDDVQDLADRMLADGLDPSTIRNGMMPLRVIFRRLAGRSDSGVTINPCAGVHLAAVRGRRERIADPTEAQLLLDALAVDERALWAAAMYAGLRRGELQALRVQDVDLAKGVIRVERSWDPVAGPVEPKSRAGSRSTPIPAVLRDTLVEHKLRLGRSDGLFFGRSADSPFNPRTIGKRAERAWAEENARRAAAGQSPLEVITLHECRHTFASLMIAAGVNAKALSTFLGHSSVMITLDRYGHLFPGSEDEAGRLLDDYLERADSAARIRQLG
jgi:integrase